MIGSIARIKDSALNIAKLAKEKAEKADSTENAPRNEAVAPTTLNLQQSELSRQIDARPSTEDLLKTQPTPNERALNTVSDIGSGIGRSIAAGIRNVSSAANSEYTGPGSSPGTGGLPTFSTRDIGELEIEVVEDKIAARGITRQTDERRLDRMQRALDASDNIPLEKLDNEELGNQVKRIEELPDPQRNKGFDQIAETGDGELLARVHNELPEEQKAEFAVAIGDSNNPDAAVEFVNELKDQTTDERYRAEGGRFPISDGKFTDQHFDVDARSVAIVVGRLGDDPAHFEQAIDSLDDEQLDAVLDASTTSTFITKPDIGVPPKYEVQTSSGNFTNITAATGRSDNPELKARVFAAGTEQLEFLRSEDSSEDDRREVTDALSRIIDSDTTGVVKALDANNQGAVIKPYSRELIDLGQEDKISEHIAKLSTGNDLSADPVDYLSASERGVNGEFHANARAAGLYVGSVAGAIDDNISDKEDAAATINRVFGLGLGAGRIGGPTAAVLKELTRGIAGDITKSDIDSDRDLRTTIIELGRPPNWNDDAKTVYGSAVAEGILF